MLPAFSRQGLRQIKFISSIQPPDQTPSQTPIGNQEEKLADDCEASALGGKSTEQLRRALGQAFVSHRDLLHPEVLEASQALDQEIVRWTKQSQEQHMKNKTISSQTVENG